MEREMKRTSEESSSFYCAEKQCRKTAKDTPEFLTEEDWIFVEKVVGFLENRDANGLYFAFKNNAALARSFFHAAIGWPEGLSYCSSLSYFEATGFRCIARVLPELKEAIAKHRNGK
jgi:hypothetical protein